MKIAIYTIAKNEEKFAERFMDSACEADMIIVADTGSTDNTIEILTRRGATVHQIDVNPWRFDVARNLSLDLVPQDVDVCVCIDLDEVLSPGWRKALEESWTPGTTRMRYQYVWSTNPDGSPGVTFWYEKIHQRHGYYWRHPVHEILYYEDGIKEVQTNCDKFTLFHYPDHSKSRSNYLPLLELSCKEDPDNDRNSHYLGREYMYYKHWDKAIEELKRHLSLPSAVWDAERSASMRYISNCYLKQGMLVEATNWCLRACAECPETREPWIDLAKVLYHREDWHGVLYAVESALKINERPMTYICEPESWGSTPYDFASIAAYQLQQYQRAVDYCTLALAINPQDSRLLMNMEFMKKKCTK
jgi:glycosyltransferase involved in cell wall biosynthesis